MAIKSDMYKEDRVNLADAIPLDTPFVIQIEPTGFCNLKCSFCPVNDENVSNKFEKKQMSIELFKSFIHQCSDFHSQIKVLRFIGNGEPLLNKKLPEMISLAHSSGIFEKIEVTTNGTLLTNELGNRIIKAGLDVLKISLEATTDEGFIEIAKTKINIAQLYENIKLFYQQKGDCIVYIKTTDIAISSDREREAFYNDWGVICDYIFIENVVPIWPEYENPIFFAMNTEKQPTRFGRREAGETICTQPFTLLSIMAGGDVFPCCADWQRKLPIGNIVHDSLFDIWNSDRLREIRLNLLEDVAEKPCSVCLFPQVSQNDDISSYKLMISNRLRSIPNEY